MLNRMSVILLPWEQHEQMRIMPDSVPEMYKFDFMHHMPKHILFVPSYKLHIELSFTVHRYKQDMLEMHITVQDMRGLDN